jgi:hypothetical protein
MHSETHREYFGRTHNSTYEVKYPPTHPVSYISSYVGAIRIFTRTGQHQRLSSLLRVRPAGSGRGGRRTDSTIEKGKQRRRRPKRAKPEQDRQGRQERRKRDAKVILSAPFCPVFQYVHDGVTGGGPQSINWAWRIIVGRGGVVGSCSPRGRQGATARF